MMFARLVEYLRSYPIQSALTVGIVIFLFALVGIRPNSSSTAPPAIATVTVPTFGDTTNTDNTPSAVDITSASRKPESRKSDLAEERMKRKFEKAAKEHAPTTPEPASRPGRNKAYEAVEALEIACATSDPELDHAAVEEATGFLLQEASANPTPETHQLLIDAGFALLSGVCKGSPFSLRLGHKITDAVEEVFEKVRPHNSFLDD